MASDFRPARFLGSAHAQTVAAALLRRPKSPKVRRERWDTPDGDFIDVDVLDGAGPQVLVLHGLEGSSRAGYVVECLRLAAARGWGAVALNFRGCSGEPNRNARSYCSGDYDDALFVLGRMKGPRLAVGFSLGGNVLLKLLAERHAEAEVTAACAVSVPFDLHACARALDGPGPMMRFYQQRFLRTLRAKALAVAARHPGKLDADRIRASRGIVGFDDAVTAPLYGLGSAAEYYAWASSGPRARHIRTPTLLISAEDDPLAPASHLPAFENPALTRLFTRHGGHCGFLAEGGVFWAEAEAFRWFDTAR
ncbi:MAG: alpha/beta fold hydrolase [Myxococcaceae bacterium]|nr:alpha/beta fold hydrolase [Myxococcaceae bacterium]